MRIFLAGVSCVGKTTIGAQLAGLLECRFFDLDTETERFFETSIERLQDRHLTSHDFRLAASQALKYVLSREDSDNCVIALPPSGLLGGYWKVVSKTRDATIVVLRDTPENILERITFYDIDSRPLQKHLTNSERGLYLREIQRDIAYFNRSFRRAHVSVDIAGCSPDEASRKIRDSLTPAPLKNQSEASERRSAERDTLEADLGKAWPVKLRSTIRAAAELDEILTSIDECPPQGARHVKERLRAVIDRLS
jgi:shikimate kinase